MRPLPNYINRIASYLPYRSKSVKNLQDQFFPSKEKKNTSIASPISTAPNNVKSEENICAQVRAIEKNEMFPTSHACHSNRGLMNPFTKKVANEAQSNDLH